MPHLKRTAALQEQFGLDFQVPYALMADSLVGLEGKRVLEIGGCLPRGLVLGELKVRQWLSIAVQPTADARLAAPEPAPPAEPAASLGRLEDLPSIAALAEHGVLGGEIEAWPRHLACGFDAIVSIACFQQMQRFPDALEGAFRALRPGGLLFALFAPVWSAPNGHHLERVLDSQGERVAVEDALIPPWGHLTMAPHELHMHLMRLTDRPTADRIVYLVHRSPRINRLLAEDYVRHVRASPFEALRLEGVFPTNVPAATQAVLERLHPRYRQFADSGMLMLLRRPG